MICKDCGVERQLYHPCPKCGKPDFKHAKLMCAVKNCDNVPTVMVEPGVQVCAKHGERQ